MPYRKQTTTRPHRKGQIVGDPTTEPTIDALCLVALRDTPFFPRLIAPVTRAPDAPAQCRVCSVTTAMGCMGGDHDLRPRPLGTDTPGRSTMPLGGYSLLRLCDIV